MKFIVEVDTDAEDAWEITDVIGDIEEALRDGGFTGVKVGISDEED